MNNRNMEQLIEKYKREMLSYSMRSARPDREEPSAEPPVATQVNLPPQLMDESAAAPENELDEALREIGQEIEEEIEEEIEQELEKRLDEEQDNEEQAPMPPLPFFAVDAQEPAVEAMAVMQREKSDEVSMTSPLDSLVDSGEELRLSLLRESCRKIASGESDASDAQKTSCTELYNFFAVNTAEGSISVETYASDQVFGVGSARVMIFIPLQSGNVIVFDGLTDVNGSSAKVTLPAPPKELSLNPENKTLPYSRYTILVEHPDYVRAIYYDVPVFEGIESIQPVQMLTKVEGANEPAPITVKEREPADLE